MQPTFGLLPLKAANAIANNPKVLPHVALGYARLDLSPFYMNAENIALGDYFGGALFAFVSPGIYEGHYLFDPSVRGSAIVRRCRAMLKAMFEDFGAEAIIGHTPVEDARARVLSRALGFAPNGTSVSPSGRSCVDVILERNAWAILSAASSGA